MQKTLLNIVIKAINEEILENPYVEVRELDVTTKGDRLFVEFSHEHKEESIVDVKEPKTFWVGDATTQAKATLTDKNNIPQPAPKLKEDYDAEINKYYGSNEQDL